MKMLLNIGKVNFDVRDIKYSQTPLWWVITNRHEAMVKILLNTGKVNVDSINIYSQTPLSWAAANRYKAVIKILLNTGKVDVDLKD